MSQRDRQNRLKIKLFYQREERKLFRLKLRRETERSFIEDIKTLTKKNESLQNRNDELR